MKLYCGMDLHSTNVVTHSDSEHSLKNNWHPYVLYLECKNTLSLYYQELH